MNRKQMILNWLALIGEDDPAVIDDVLNRCRADPEALDYFLKRANEVIKAE